MPNKINITEIESQLPEFVKILPETYKGARYKAKFLDLEYNQEFEAIVKSVIKLQHGCKKRSNKMRSETLLKRGTSKAWSAEKVQEYLPNHLRLDFQSYTAIRKKARFFDKIAQKWFEAYPFNILREKSGYAPERRMQIFIDKVSISAEEIQGKIDKTYGAGKIVLVKDSFVNINSLSKWLIDNRINVCSAHNILNGKFLNKNILSRWVSMVKSRDNFTCQKCNSSKEVCAHHILTWSRYLEQRFNVNNGITLCKNCHNEYHAKHKNQETIDNFCEFMGNETAKSKLSLPPIIPRIPE